MNFIRKKITNKIICAMIPAVILTYMCVFLVINQESKSVVKNNFIKEIELSSQGINKEMHVEVNKIIGVMMNIQTSVEKSCTTTEEIKKYILSIADAYLDIIPNGIYCGLEDGTYIDKLWEPDADWIMKERPWYKEGLKSDQVTFGEMYLDADSGEYIISIYANIKDSSGKVLGVVSADLPLTNLKHMLEEQKVAMTGYSFAIDTYTGIIMGNRENSDWNGKAIDEINSPILAKVKEMQEKEEYGQVKLEGGYYISTEKITDTNFLVVIVVPKGDIVETISELRNVTFATMAIGMIFVIGVIVIILKLLMKPIPMIDEAINRVKDLDMTAEIKVRSIDELGNISKNMNQLSFVLKETMGNIQSEIGMINAQTDVNTEIAKHLQDSTEVQLEAMTNLTSTLHELNDGIQTISQGTEQLTESAADTTKASSMVEEKVQYAVSLVGDGKVQMEQMNKNMQNISEVSNEVQNSVGNVAKGIEGINEMVKVIQDIADQTNLLALNASIEAARAGESGKGFAVVADEIRQLAEGCTSSVEDIVRVTSEIEELIKVLAMKTENSIEAVNVGVKNVGETSKVFENINENVKDINQVMGQVNDAIININGVITDMAASIQEQTASTQIISDTYGQVMEISEGFAEDGKKVVVASGELKEKVSKINQEIQKFKVE